MASATAIMAVYTAQIRSRHLSHTHTPLILYNMTHNKHLQQDKRFTFSPKQEAHQMDAIPGTHAGYS